MSSKPLVTIMIATRDRHEDLATTVFLSRQQEYSKLEMIVIDDGSEPPIEPAVRAHWPNATIIRHESSRGQSARRNEGFGLAHGKYVLELDDDCTLTGPDAISKSVEYMEATPGCAALIYYDCQGDEVPANLANSLAMPGNCGVFVGAAVFLRKEALEQTKGYRDFLVGAEETELSLQLLKLGWSMSYRPEIVSLHRVSLKNRNRRELWKSTLRNSLWIILIHFPVSRIPLEAGWKITMGALNAFRLKRKRLLIQALAEAVMGARQVWKLRDPLDRLSLRRLDAIRAYGVLPYELFDNPPAVRWAQFTRWLKRWKNRTREQSSS